MRGRPRWYVVGRVGGHVVFDGPHASEALANKKAGSINDWDDNDWEVRMYRTEDMAVAKAAWKSEQAQTTGSMSQSLRPIRTLKPRKKIRYEQYREERGLI